MDENYHLRNIRDLLIKGFSESELRDDLCFYEPDFLPLRQQLPQGAGQDIVVQKILDFALQKVKFDQLLEWAKSRNPTRYENHKPYLETRNKSKTHNSLIADIRAISVEIELNLYEIDRFIERGYELVNDKIIAGGKVGVEFKYITCQTSTFKSKEVQQALLVIPEDIKKRLFNVYHGFREINDKADALKKVFRTWRVGHYIKAIEEFNSILRKDAEYLKENLLTLEL